MKAATETPSQDPVTNPKLPASDFQYSTRYLAFGAFPSGTLITLPVPKSMFRRRVYAGMVATTLSGFPSFPTYTGELVFRLAGNVVLRLPFSRGEAGRISLRTGAEARSLIGGAISYSALQSPPPHSLLVTFENPLGVVADQVIPPWNMDLMFDTFELSATSITTSEDNIAAVLACHSEGFSE